MRSGRRGLRYYSRCDPSSQDDPSQFTICMFRSEYGLSSIPKIRDADTGVNRLYFAGKGRLSVIDMHDLRAFRQYVPQTPVSNYAWVIYGQLKISIAGSYNLCISSDDGSKLYVDGVLLVNDEGLHGMLEKCGRIDLSSNSHTLYIEGFQAGGAVGMEAKYSGPDTGNKVVYIRSGLSAKGSLRSTYRNLVSGISPIDAGQIYSGCDPSAISSDSTSFSMCMFRSEVFLSKIPYLTEADTGWNRLYYVGKGQLATVDLNSLDQFRAVVPNTPDVNYAWAIIGKLVIGTGGNYQLCITSDDGSALFLDNMLLIDDEGLHGMLEKCVSKDLSSGSHSLYITGFQAGGAVGMRANYMGPDTDYEKVLIRSGVVPKSTRYFSMCNPANIPDSTDFTVCMFRSDVGLGVIPKIGAADTPGSRLHFVGKGLSSRINYRSLEEFRRVVSATPGSDYAWAILGRLKIGIAGNYQLCINSDDGSKLYLDGPLFINDDGLHGMVERCASKFLGVGSHDVYVEGFQAGGGVGMIATYSGPDTGDEKILLRSGVVVKNSRYYPRCDPSNIAGDPSQFTICMFRSEVGLGVVPKLSKAGDGVSRLYYEGQGKLPVVDIHDVQGFRQYVSAVPDTNYAWAIIGQLKIGTAGVYSLCISSDDGSKLYIDGGLIANDDGLHGMVERCGQQQLNSGTHSVYIEGFQAGGAVGMEAKYSGPDTGGKMMFMRSGSVASQGSPPRYYPLCDPSSSKEDKKQFTVCVFRSEVFLPTIPALGQADTGLNRLYFVGKGSLRTVDIHRLEDFRSVVPYTPSVNYAWTIFGTLRVGITGVYTLCIESDDGSKLYLDGNLLVDNEGLHGMVDKCKDTMLASGSHSINIEGFQAGGAVGMVGRYSGPDTEGKRVLLTSGRVSSRYYPECDPAGGEDSSKFTICMFKSPTFLSSTPRIGDAVATGALEYVGKGRMPAIDMHDLQTFRQFVPQTPNENYAWAMYGSLVVVAQGSYKLCISSDDGSKLYVDGIILADDDGLHGMVERCGQKTLGAGSYKIYIEGFQAGGAVGMELRYAGPDTGGQLIYMQSGSSSVPSGRYYPGCDPSSVDPSTKNFILCMFRSEVALGRIPAIGQADNGRNRLYFVDKGNLPIVDLHTVDNFRAAVRTPDFNYAWSISGKLVVDRGGSYEHCIISDDGSRLYIDGNLVADDEGLHGMVERCGKRDLTSGIHDYYIEGFQAWGGVGMEAKYSGPDTNFKKVYVRSGAAPRLASSGLRYFPKCDPTTGTSSTGGLSICMFRSEVDLVRIPSFGDADTGLNRLYYVGRGQMPSVDVWDLGAFRQFVPTTPDVNYAWVIYGQLVISSPGVYNLCITSDDGSKIYVDGSLVADNEGLHGMVERCGPSNLAAGSHVIVVEGFQCRGGVGMVVKYSGPDTGGAKVLVMNGRASSIFYPSCLPPLAGSVDPSNDQFNICMFKSLRGLDRTPRIGDAVAAGTLQYVGKGRMPVVDMDELQNFREYVSTPDAQYAWAIYGQLMISVQGLYNLCITSDDGSLLYVDGPLLVDDDGLHGMVERCSNINLSPGAHSIYISGFQAGGGVGMWFRYSGPDTGGRKLFVLPGTVAAPPPELSSKGHSHVPSLASSSKSVLSKRRLSRKQKHSATRVAVGDEERSDLLKDISELTNKLKAQSDEVKHLRRALHNDDDKRQGVVHRLQKASGVDADEALVFAHSERRRHFGQRRGQ